MNKKLDFKNINLQSAISRKANNVMTLHTVKKEWRITIVILGVLKLFTMFLSVFAGYSYFSLKFSNIFSKVEFFGIHGTIIGNIASVIALLTLELLTAMFLQKMFKFFYRHRFITGALSLLVVAIFYTVSFIASTNGLASRQSEKKDDSIEILNSAKNKKLSLEKDYTKQLSDYNKQIHLINSNPQGWSGGKRIFLTEKQLRNIAVLSSKKENDKLIYDKKLKDVELETYKKLKVNKKVKSETAKDYYQVMAIVMVLQFFVTGIIMLFYYLIRNQENKDAIVSEDIKEIANTVSGHAEIIIMNAMVDTSNRIANGVAENMQQNQTQDYVHKLVAEKKLKKNGFFEEKEEENKFEKEEVLHKKISGFGNKKNEFKTEKKTIENLAEVSGYPKTTAVLNSSNLLYLKKHKKLVLAIKKTSSIITDSISNSDVRIVQNNVPKNVQKSKSLIQRVFLVMQAVDKKELEKLINKI